MLRALPFELRYQQYDGVVRRHRQPHRDRPFVGEVEETRQVGDVVRVVEHAGREAVRSQPDPHVVLHVEIERLGQPLREAHAHSFRVRGSRASLYAIEIKVADMTSSKIASDGKSVVHQALCIAPACSER